MPTVPDPDRLCDLLEVCRGPVTEVLPDLVGIPRPRVEDALEAAGVDPLTPAAAITDAEVARVRQEVLRP